MTALQDKYKEEVIPGLKEALGVSNAMEVPKLSKIVVNMGLGIADKDEIKTHTAELESLTGQRPVLNKARKSISNFKLREGMIIGARTTLRGARMYDFLDRLINAVLPRIRDFRGVSSTAFDGRGNYTLGIVDQTIFPEIDPNNVNKTQGMDVTIVTTAASDEAARKLLELLGMPFAGNQTGGAQVG